MKELTVEQIKKLIDVDNGSMNKAFARVAQKYYDGEHDIMKYRVFYYDDDGELVEDRYRSNERISHPFFTELVDQLTAYLMSDEENIIVSDTEGLQEHLDKYFNETFYAELSDCITDGSIKGFSYLYAYKNDKNRLSFQCADALDVIEVRAKDTDSGCQAVIYRYTDHIAYNNKTVTRIQVHYADKIAFFVQTDNGKIESDGEITPNPRPNIVYIDKKGNLYGLPLGFIPFWRFDYNRKRISALKPIKGIIDDYDLMECGLSNNLQDFDKPLHVVKGFQGSDLNELQQNIKTKKIIGVDDTGDVEIKTIQVPYEARKAKLAEDEKNIYRFGMGLNLQGLKDTTATTNIAIKAAYTLLDLKAKKVIKNLKKFLKQIIKVVVDEINEQNDTGFSVEDVKIKFHPNILLNETENANNEKTSAETQRIKVNLILDVVSLIGDEEALKLICDIIDIDFEQVKSVLEDRDDIEDAKKALESVITEGGGQD